MASFPISARFAQIIVSRGKGVVGANPEPRNGRVFRVSFPGLRGKKAHHAFSALFHECYECVDEILGPCECCWEPVFVPRQEPSAEAREFCEAIR
jgi:hypothetical protein